MSVLSTGRHPVEFAGPVERITADPHFAEMKQKIEAHRNRMALGETAIAADGGHYESPSEYARAFSRLENHYFQNAGFLPSDGWILQNRHRIAHIPCTIVQGRYDMVCPPISAWSLAHGWAGCDLRLINMAGHALSEAGISEALVRVMDGLRDGVT